MYLPLTILYFFLFCFLAMMVSFMKGFNNFLGLLKQTITNLLALNDRNVFSYSSGSQKPEIKVLAVLSFLWKLEGRLLLCLFRPLASAGNLWLLGASFQSLPLSSHGLLLHVCVSISFSLLKTLDLGLILIQTDLILRSFTWLPLKRSLFQIRLNLNVIDGWISWRATIPPTARIWLC